MPSQRKAGVVLGYLNIIVKNLVNLVYTPMLLSFVGQAEYGVYQACYSFVFSLTLLSFGFSQAYVRFYMRKRARGENVGSLNGVYLVLYGVASVIALLIGLSFASSADSLFAGSFTSGEIAIARAVMTVMAGSISVTLFNSVFDAYIVAHEEFGFQQSRQMLTTLATPICAYGLLNLGFGVIGVAIAQLLVTATLLILNAAYCKKRLEMHFLLKPFDGRLFQSIAKFSAWVFANQVCDLANQNVPNVLLGALTNASAVAVFSVSVQIRYVFVSLSTTIYNVFTPEVNRIVAESDDNERLTKLMTRVGRFQMILFCWVYGGFFLLGNYFIEKWAGSGFSDAYYLVLTMTLPLIIPLSQNIGIEVQRARNMHHARSVAMLVAAIVNIIFTIIVSPFCSYWAPSIGFGLSVVLCDGVFMNWYYQKRLNLNIKYFWKKNIPVVIAGIVVIGACFIGMTVQNVNGWTSFFVWGIAYTLLFAAVIWRIVLEKKEREAVFRRLPFIG